MALNARQQKFVQAYIRTNNATEAAKAAGYSEKTAYQQGHVLLKHPEISAALQEAVQEVVEELHFDAVQWLKDGVELARSDIGDYFDADMALKKLKDMTPAQRRAISSIEVEAETDKHGKIYKLKLWPKNEARDQLARHLGLYEKDNTQAGKTFADLVLAAQRRREGKR